MKPLEQEDIHDPIADGEFGAPARRVTSLKPVPVAKYLRNKEDHTQIWPYSPQLAARSDLVEGFDGPLPSKMSDERLVLEQRLRLSTSRAEQDAVVKEINEYNEGVRARAYLARKAAEDKAKADGAPPPPKV